MYKRIPLSSALSTNLFSSSFHLPFSIIISFENHSFIRTKKGRISLCCNDFHMLDACIPRYIKTHIFRKISYVQWHKNEKDTRKNTTRTGTLRRNSERDEGPSAQEAWKEAQIGEVYITTRATLSGSHVGQTLCLYFCIPVAYHGARRL